MLLLYRRLELLVQKYCIVTINSLLLFWCPYMVINVSCCCCCFSHSAHWLPTRKKLLYTVANPARGLLNREKKKKKKSGSAPPPPPARCSFGEKIKIIK